MKPVYIIILCILNCISVTGKCQDLDELIKLHRNNLRDLYESRGVRDKWHINGDVNKRDLIKSLNDYADNIGLLIYNHKQDTLTITLINKKGKVLTDKKRYTRDSLIDQVNKANLLFSRSFVAKSPSKRGVSLLTFEKVKSNLPEAFENINNSLLPFKDSLVNFEHLIIVPTLNIATLPFAAFKITDNKYLIDVMSYSIAPSLFELMASKQMNVNRGANSRDKIYYKFTNALFVANPAFASDNDWNFPNLPGTLKEINYITKSLDTSSYVLYKGEKATISNIKPRICNYDLLYFATHGISDSDNPLDNSFLELADDANHMSHFTAREIQDIRLTCSLKADLVVLSACRTGLGKEHAGGIIGLARAFQIAGANHVLMSLWSINDEETAVLMSYFFDNLKISSRMMPHEALRRAIMKYKKEVNDNPNYWASFSIFGIPY